MRNGGKFRLAFLVLALSFSAISPAIAEPRTDEDIAAVKTLMVEQPDKAWARAQRAMVGLSATRQGDRITLTTLSWLSAEALTRQGRPKEAVPILQAALKSVVSLQPGGKLHADVLKSLGAAEASVGNVQTALERFQEAYGIYSKGKLRRDQAITLQEIGTIYADARDYPKVMQYYRQSREIYSDDPMIEVIADNNTAFALKDMGRYAEASTAFRRAIIAARKLDSPYVEANLMANLAFVEALEGRWQLSRADVARGLALVARYPEAASQKPYLVGVKAKIAAARGDPVTASRLLDDMFAGMDLATTDSSFRDFHELATWVYERTGDKAKSLQHLKALKRLDDESRSLAASTNAALMSARFDFANQAAKISDLKLGQAQAKARFTTILAIVLTVSGLVVTGLITSAFLSMRRSRNRIRAAHDELESTNTALEKALKAKTEFLATTSHEIRTPLNGILGMTQVMLADKDLPARIRERLNLVQSSGDAMNALVSDLLDVAKIETGHLTVEPAPMNLRNLLNDVAGMWVDQARSRGIAFNLDIAKSPGAILADGDRLRQVLFNLLSNAIKFTEKGSVSLVVDVVDCPLGERLRLSVADTGIGIPADQLEHVFESFTQVDGGKSRQYGGTGLGLTICRSIAEALGGSISVESALGSGSTFTVDLPLIRSGGTVGSSGAAGHILRLLVVDGNPMNQAMFKAAVTDDSISLAFAAGVDEALASIETQAFDTIIIDGSALVRRFADDPVTPVGRLVASAGAPVIALWPSPGADTRAALAAVGVARVDEKPVALPELLKSIQTGVAAAPPPERALMQGSGQ